MPYSPPVPASVRHRSKPSAQAKPRKGSPSRSKIARVVHELLRQKDVSDATFEAAHRLVGTQGVVDWP